MDTVDKPCWWTELLALPENDIIINAAFYRGILPYLDVHKKVFRYAGFFAAEIYFIERNNLSASGRIYNA